MAKIVLNFLRDDSGATALEYGLIATGIAVAIVKHVGSGLSGGFTTINGHLTTP
jgi:pilus assembly protein Flp/PilA